MNALITFTLSLFFLLQQLTAAEDIKPAVKLHVCTVAAYPDKAMAPLLSSCDEHGIDIDILGVLKPQRGLGERLLFVQEYIKDLSDDDVVLYVDHNDVLILASPEEILNAFQEAGAPFVISVERYCFPYPEKAADFPNENSTFRFLNSGSYIGYVGTLKAMFKEMSPIDAFENDQSLLMSHYFEHPGRYCFDSKCKLFMPLAGVIKEELEIDVQNRKVICKETHSSPCIIHGNGGSFPLYEEIYGELYKKEVPAAEREPSASL